MSILIAKNYLHQNRKTVAQRLYISNTFSIACIGLADIISQNENPIELIGMLIFPPLIPAYIEHRRVFFPSCSLLFSMHQFTLFRYLCDGWSLLLMAFYYRLVLIYKVNRMSMDGSCYASKNCEILQNFLRSFFNSFRLSPHLLHVFLVKCK